MKWRLQLFVAVISAQMLRLCVYMAWVLKKGQTSSFRQMTDKVKITYLKATMKAYILLRYSHISFISTRCMLAIAKTISLCLQLYANTTQISTRGHRLFCLSMSALAFLFEIVTVCDQSWNEINFKRTLKLTQIRSKHRSINETSLYCKLVRKRQSITAQFLLYFNA